MKRVALIIAMVLPQVAGGQTDPFMDLTMPDLEAPALQSEAERLGEAESWQGGKAPADPLVDLSVLDTDVPIKAAEQERIVKGCVVPGRPEWTVNFPPKERQKGTLIRLMHERLWLSKVTQSGSCSCENRWPKWEVTGAIFNLYMKDLDANSITAIYQSISKGNDALVLEANAICEKENI